MNINKKLKTSILAGVLSLSITGLGIVDNQVYASSKSKNVSNSVISFTNYTVKAKKAKVRSTSSSRGKVITTLSKGKEVIVLTQKGNWSQIRYNKNRTGWTQTKDLEKSYVPNGKQVVIGVNTQLKQSTSSKSTTLRQLKKGTVVFYTGVQKNGWTKVEDGHYVGYVLTKHTK